MTGWYAAGIVCGGLGLNMAIGLGLIRHWVRAHPDRQRQAIVDALEANDVHLYKQLRRP